jgi:FAD/FMN-containing dehydrogenase
MMEQFDEYLDQSDYLVGWIDAFARRSSLGRGQIHRATYLDKGTDPNPSQTLRLDNQHLPDTLLLMFPRSVMWRAMRPFMNNLGARVLNFGRYWTSRWGHDSTFRQPHAAFHFLLDYVPDWKRAYGREGLIQYQCFIPKDSALEAFSEILARCQERGIPNYLTVLKRHRSDDFLISHGVDGYSMAMDFRVTRRRKDRLITLAAEMDDIVLQAGGRFYLAKDSTLRPQVVKAFLGDEVIDKFRTLKSELDPEGLLQTNLWRRLFQDL